MNIISQLKEKYNLSIWLDYLDREILEVLDQWVKEKKIFGITTNPSIFNNAINKFPEYYLSRETVSNDIFRSIENIMIEEVKKACDIMLPLFEETKGQDGLVSIEVPPYIAYDTQKTVEKAEEIWNKISMPNVMIKIPATNEGIQAIKILFDKNINVNVTLLFSIKKYSLVAQTYKNSQTNSISVASFFVSRVDTIVDDLFARMKENKFFNVPDLFGKAAVANSLLAYKLYQNTFNDNSKIQRILWASTSTKNPAYHPLKYFLELLTPNSINTIPLQTYQTLIKADINIKEAEKITQKNMEEAEEIIKKLDFLLEEKLGLNLEYLMEELLYRGVTLFTDSYNSILYSVIKNAGIKSAT